MSGGVDSSVAAWMLREQGYDCVGVFMRVGTHLPDDEAICPAGPGAASPHASAPRRLKHGCCSAADALDARAIAGKLGIPFYALNFEKEFDGIIEYFVDEYARARTPNPCVMCNIRLKFGALLRYADMLGADYVATGHYARIVRGDSGTTCLARSLNQAKDQSYVLFGIRREELPRCLFPLGEMANKAEVRSVAERLGLRVHDKPDSQEICFVPNNDYKQLVRLRRPDAMKPGEVRDASGRTIGLHEGVAGYTIGQRRGLGIAAGTPIYVTSLDVLANTVTVGSREALMSAGLAAEQVNWLVEPPAIGSTLPAETKIRYMHAPAAGRLVVVASDRVRVEFDRPQSAVTPGQAAVFYRADGVVLGGGWIREGISERDEVIGEK